jgi:hypothetical protein
MEKPLLQPRNRVLPMVHGGKRGNLKVPGGQNFSLD